MNLCLISDAEPVRAAVRATCLPPHYVAIFGLKGFLDENNRLSDYGKTVVEAAQAADAVLIGWSLEQAPLINTICFAVRSTKTFIPVIALCSGGQQDMIAALAAGADDVTNLPLYIPLFQACVAAQKRVVKAAERATATKIQKKLIDKQNGSWALVQDKTGMLVEEVIEELEEQFEANRENPLLPVNKPVGQVIETIAQTLEKEADHFMKTLVQDVMGDFGESVAEELVLLDPDHDVTQLGDLILDRTAYRFHIGSDEVELTPKEFELLGFMMAHAGDLCTRDQILDVVWGIDFETGTNMVDVYMHFLRKKLDTHGLGDVLETIRGRGYRLALPPAHGA